MAAAILRAAIAVLLAFTVAGFTPAMAADNPNLSEPWKKGDRALVIDAYEYNPIDWNAVAGNKRVAGFINKGSDGLPPPYYCFGDETEIRLCKALWKRYSVARELYHTRKTVAKSLGLKWGVYHLGRPGNPVAQAEHLIDFAEPDDDDLIAIDIEGNDPSQWMSLEDAETFARVIKGRVGRYPVLYTNASTARYIATHRSRYTLLSRLPIWYARYKPSIKSDFPRGHWKEYALWQFASHINCKVKGCPMRIAGTPDDIDINVAPFTVAGLKKVWPFGGLVRKSAPDVLVAGSTFEPEASGTMPLPVSREDGLKGRVTIEYVQVIDDSARHALIAAYQAAAGRYSMPLIETVATGEGVILNAKLLEAYQKAGDRYAMTAVVVTSFAEETVPNAKITAAYRALLGKAADQAGDEAENTAAAPGEPNSGLWDVPEYKPRDIALDTEAPAIQPVMHE